MELKLHDYQKRAIEMILSTPAVGLFLDMGLGKTAIALTAANALMYDSFEIARVLVIAPLRVAEDTWSREAEKWDHLKHLRISKILGSAEKRKAALKEDADIYVINRENVVWLIGYLEDHKKPWPFDMLIIDELSSFKSSQAKRFKALRRVRPLCDRVVGLTGTPAANSLMDLWAEMYLLDRGQRLGSTITGYRQRYFRPAYFSGPVVYKWEPMKGSLKEITEKISDITVSMKAKDYLELPERIDNTISVHLDEKAAAVYQRMEREALVELDGEEITALNAAAVMTKLLQLSSGFAYDEKKEAKRIHTLKLDALKEIIEAAASPVLVYYNFTADRDLILNEVEGSVLLDSDKAVKDWNDGSIPVLLAHPMSAGYGLNLQEGGHIVVWYGVPWSLEQYQQANARLLRQGQKHTVMIYHLVSSGTVDDQVMQSLVKKDMTQSTLIEILKDRRAMV